MSEYTDKQMKEWKAFFRKRNRLMDDYFKEKDADKAKKIMNEISKTDKQYAAIPQEIRLKFIK